MGIWGAIGDIGTKVVLNFGTDWREIGPVVVLVVVFHRL